MFHRVFDLGGGEQVALVGVANGGAIGGTSTRPEGGGTFTLVRMPLALDCTRACEPVTPPRFVDVDFALSTPCGRRHVSWFDVATNALFASHVDRGAASRDDLVLTAAERNADPLAGDGEQFTSDGALPAGSVLHPP